jgi:hypothetical protein
LTTPCARAGPLAASTVASMIAPALARVNIPGLNEPIGASDRESRPAEDEQQRRRIMSLRRIETMVVASRQ